MAESSPLLELPAELRNNIWRGALISGYEAIDVTNKDTPQEPGLLAVCQQIRIEALAIYYAENKFLVRFKPFDPQSERIPNICWLRYLTAERCKLITSMSLQINPASKDSSPSKLLRCSALSSNNEDEIEERLIEKIVREELIRWTSTGLGLDAVFVEPPKKIETTVDYFRHYYKMTVEKMKRERLLLSNDAAESDGSMEDSGSKKS